MKYFARSIHENQGLPLYVVDQKLPNDWEQLVITLQSQYLNETNQSSDAVLLSQTLQSLVSIARLHDVAYKSNELLTAGLAWSAVGLLEFYVLLLDLEVNELFSNKIGTSIIISHRKLGRCETNVVFSQQLWESLKTRAELDSGQILTPLSPALKIGFETKLGSLRVSLQIPPLAVEGATFAIRRLPSRTISLKHLIEQGQISSDYAKYLLHAVQERKSIIIAGEPGSGKTTLANALLLLTDTTWRLIVIEDARELRMPIEEFPLLTRYNMPAVGDDDRSSKRVTEIARLLHRSPDYVFLGEIQNADDTIVAMEGFAAGLHGMATTHAKDLRGLLARWQFSHKISIDLLGAIDVIVITTRQLRGNKVELRVSAVYEQIPSTTEYQGFQEVNK